MSGDHAPLAAELDGSPPVRDLWSGIGWAPTPSNPCPTHGTVGAVTHSPCFGEEEGLRAPALRGGRPSILIVCGVCTGVVGSAACALRVCGPTPPRRDAGLKGGPVGRRAVGPLVSDGCELVGREDCGQLPSAEDALPPRPMCDATVGAARGLVSGVVVAGDACGPTPPSGAPGWGGRCDETTAVGSYDYERECHVISHFVASRVSQTGCTLRACDKSDGHASLVCVKTR